MHGEFFDKSLHVFHQVHARRWDACVRGAAHGGSRAVGSRRACDARPGEALDAAVTLPSTPRK